MPLMRGKSHDGKLALYEDTSWAFIAPQAGWLIWDEAQETILLLTTNGWTPMQGARAPEPLLFETLESIFEPAAGLGSLEIPSHITLLGVTARVLETITGPQSWQLGTAKGKGPFRV